MERKSADENFAKIRELLKNISKEEISSFKISPTIESDDELMGRVLTFLREISVGHPNKNVLVITHGGVMREMMIRLSLDTTTDVNYHISNAAYIKLQSDGVDFFVKETSGITLKR